MRSSAAAEAARSGWFSTIVNGQGLWWSLVASDHRSETTGQAIGLSLYEDSLRSFTSSSVTDSFAGIFNTTAAVSADGH